MRRISVHDMTGTAEKCGGRAERDGNEFRPAPDPSVYPIINCIFLVMLLGGTLLLACLEVTPWGTVRAPWLDRELPAVCVHATATGMPCPSCGITRSLITGLHTDFERSHRFHPAGLVILLMLLIQCAMRLAFLRQRFRWPALDVALSFGMVCYFAWLLNVG
jgi:Protein of unknown function (DUF2752)